MRAVVETNTQNASAKLSRREAEVLNLILEGQSSQQVADTLCCTKRNVDFHLSNVYRKLNVTNRVQAMRKAAVLGLLGDLTAEPSASI